MKEKLLILFIFLCLVCIKCNNIFSPYTPLEGKLISLIDNKLKQSDIVFFSIRSVTNFEWERMYVFSGNEDTPESISESMQINYTQDDLEEGDYRLIFVNKGKIVYEENLYDKNQNKNIIGFEIPLDSTRFPIKDSGYNIENNYFTYGINDSFFIEKKKFRNYSDNYYLYHCYNVENKRLKLKFSK